MSFSGKVKEELSRQISTARHCQIAEIAAILSVCGQVSISANDHFCVTVHTENVSVANYLSITYLSDIFQFLR